MNSLEEEIKLAPKTHISQFGEEQHLTPNKLCDFMGFISESAHCASWASGIEYHLWTAIEDMQKRGASNYDDYNLTKLKNLSRAADGWIIYHDTPDNWGQVFVPMENWLRIYEAYRRENHLL